jgi:hypothetical protein
VQYWFFDSHGPGGSMTAQADLSYKPRRRKPGVPLLPVAAFILLLLAGGGFIGYVLWPQWPGATAAQSPPDLPITVAGVLFEVPPAAIRAAVQRHPGPHQRVDLAFLWPSLKPPQADATAEPTPPANGAAAGDPSPKSEAADASGRLFVTIDPLGALLPPIERLRSIYPRYAAARPTTGPAGLAVLPFRDGTPYEGEDLVYAAANPNTFYARCTRPLEMMPGTCVQERAVGSADVTLRFTRAWLEQWRAVAAGFDRLLGQLHPQND